ncbi:hypothetical protein N658DRAFT_482497 [Parathielavia hyrcaniae]|uniref:TM7S3/TM198-like domain-containing protein n=1 Tax=Parathielavia hyrcaniae TaxID=113614 RepID=A0AAN6T6L5_9PEZI|nr:hypothetical protein N658DRAFT_482497 [Parathielavia hyrcaniae]
MRLLAASGQAWLCLCLLHSLTAAATDHARRQETTAAADSPSPLPSTATRTLTDDEQTSTTTPTPSTSVEVTSTTLPSTPPPASSFPIPTPTEDANSALFNATVPEDQLPLEPQVTPGWAVAGTILIITGTIFALAGVRAQRLQTFFSTAFLAALGTTVLILYLMTPPVSDAVQGAFVVAAVCTGAALGGLALLFRDLVEGLGCGLGGFSLSMWLLTLRAGGLVGGPHSNIGKIVFIAAFTCAGLSLYFSHWTRAYGLVAGISFAGSTAAVLGIDCFSRAGLKEFWAYIWAVNNEGLFPEGTATYPLTRGIRVELALTIILFVVGGISQLKLWRVVRDRRNKSKVVPTDEEAAVRPDEEESVGRRVEEMTAQERREWERVYGDAGSGRGRATDSAVGDTESEKPDGPTKGASVTSAAEAWSPVETPDGLLLPRPANESPQAQGIAEKDVGDGKATVRVVEDNVSEGNSADGGAQEKARSTSQNVATAPATSPSLESTQAPAVIPLPFQIPPPRSHKAESSIAAVAEDEASMAAAAEDSDEPTIAARDDDTGSVPRMWRNSVSIQRSLPRHSADCEVRGNTAPKVYQNPAQPIKATGDDLDSVIAILDDESSSGDADSTILDSPRLPEVDVGASFEGKEQGVWTDQEKQSPSAPADEVTEDEGSPAVGGLGQQSVPSLSLPSIQQPSTEIGETTEKQEEAAAPRERKFAEATECPAPSATESKESAPKTTARLTKMNLPPALPGVALTYRTNEWAKHLSIAETPDPEALQVSDPITEAPEEQPAHLDVVELQRTAVNGAPLPAAPRTSSALSINPPHDARSASRISLTASETGLVTSAAPDPQYASRPAAYRSTSAILGRQSPMLLPEPIAEEDAETRGTPGAQPAGDIQAALPTVDHGHPASRSTSDLVIQPSAAYAHAKPQTLIGMREMLLRSRASGLSTAMNQATIIRTPTPTPTPTDPATAIIRSHSPPTQPTSQPPSSSKPDADLDDLPLSQRRSLIRASQSQNSLLQLQPAQQQPPRAESPTFVDPYQSARHHHRSISPRESAREAQLAQFRSSVESFGGGITTPPAQPPAAAGAAGMGVYYGHSGGSGGAESSPDQQQKSEYALRSMELQRRVMLGQKEAEARRREAEAAEKHRYQREFEERMRSGALMGVHRDAMRRLQKSVKD